MKKSCCIKSVMSSLNLTVVKRKLQTACAIIGSLPSFLNHAYVELLHRHFVSLLKTAWQWWEPLIIFLFDFFRENIANTYGISCPRVQLLFIDSCTCIVLFKKNTGSFTLPSQVNTKHNFSCLECCLVFWSHCLLQKEILLLIWMEVSVEPV